MFDSSFVMALTVVAVIIAVVILFGGMITVIRGHREGSKVRIFGGWLMILSVFVLPLGLWGSAYML